MERIGKGSVGVMIARDTPTKLALPTLEQTIPSLSRQLATENELVRRLRMRQADRMYERALTKNSLKPKKEAPMTIENLRAKQQQLLAEIKNNYQKMKPE